MKYSLLALLLLISCGKSQKNTPEAKEPPLQSNSCLFNGNKVDHLDWIYAYEESSVDYGVSCLIERRDCNNGVLSGSANYSTCEPEVPKSCLFNGRTISHNSSVYAYSSNLVPYGSYCQGQWRTCSDGTLSGLNVAETCSVQSEPIPAPNPVITVYVKYNAMNPGGCYASPQQFTCNSSTQTMSLSYLGSFRNTNYPYCQLNDKGSNLYEIDCRSSQTCQQYYSAGYCGGTYERNYLVGSCSSVYGVLTEVYSNCRG